MSLDIIRISSNDNLATIIHELKATTEPVVLLVMPPNGRALLGEMVDMAQVKQTTQEMGIEIGIVSIDSKVRKSAMALDVPIYRFVMTGRRMVTRRRPWWFPEKRRFEGAQTIVNAGDREAMHRRIIPLPRWARYFQRYTAILLFCMTIAIVGISAYYTVPQATLTLKPNMEPIFVSQQIVADPRYDENSAGGATVPGRLLVSVSKQRASVETTGIKEVPTAPARGLVTFANLIPQSIVIPAGTRVSTSTGERIIYQTVREASTPAQLGGEVDVEVIAIEPGTKGNVPTDRINRVEGALSAQLNVRNLFPMTGGAIRFAPAVDVKDRERLREHVLDILFEQAKADMIDELDDDEFLAEDSIRLIFIYEETFSHFLGEETPTLTFEVRAESHGTAVNETLALDLVLDELNRSVPEGFTILDDTIQTRTGELLGADGAGRVSLELIGEGLIVADLALIDTIDKITGQDVPTALGYVNENLPLRDIPEVKIWPDVFERMPFLTARIYTQVDTESYTPPAISEQPSE